MHRFASVLLAAERQLYVLHSRWREAYILGHALFVQDHNPREQFSHKPLKMPFNEILVEHNGALKDSQL